MILCYDNLPDVIWGEMYGRDHLQYPNEPSLQYIEIYKSQLNRSKKDDCVLYEWSWPGRPGSNYNIYFFKNYGKTWAFTKEELVGEKI